MSTSNTLQYYAANAQQTQKLGALVASFLTPGNLVLLNGTLGAGKSALARASIRALLDQPDMDVPSPTFLLVLPYGNDNVSILHSDLYRLEHEVELEELGLFDDPSAIIFVEWPERAPALMTQADLFIDLTFTQKGEGRMVRITSPQNSPVFNALSQHPVFINGAEL